MSKLQNLISKSQNSAFYRNVLNFILARSIPFNAPHHFRILAIGEGIAKVLLPFRKANLNHVKGIHACALATLCEYTTGLALLTIISESQYRIILKSLKMEYHYQAKMDVTANYNLTQSFIYDNISVPLLKNDAVFIDLEIKVTDQLNNQICTGFITWQIKKWTKVKSN